MRSLYVLLSTKSGPASPSLRKEGTIGIISAPRRPAPRKAQPKRINKSFLTRRTSTLKIWAQSLSTFHTSRPSLGTKTCATVVLMRRILSIKTRVSSGLSSYQTQLSVLSRNPTWPDLWEFAFLSTMWHRMVLMTGQKVSGVLAFPNARVILKHVSTSTSAVTCRLPILMEYLIHSLWSQTRTFPSAQSRLKIIWIQFSTRLLTWSMKPTVLKKCRPSLSIATMKTQACQERNQLLISLTELWSPWGKSNFQRVIQSWSQDGSRLKWRQKRRHQAKSFWVSPSSKTILVSNETSKTSIWKTKSIWKSFKFPWTF